MTAETSHASNSFVTLVGESDGDFDERVHSLLFERYSTEIDDVLQILGDIQLEYESLGKVHNLQLRRGLIGRQCLPYFLVHESYFPARPINKQVLAAVVAGHTLALTQLDYHLDGSVPSAASQTAVKVAPEQASAYAMRMAYLAGRLAERARCADLFSSVLDPISGFVVARMHEDWHRRYELPPVGEDLARQIEGYVRDDCSRLMASGYWDAMSRAVFVAEECTRPAELDAYIRILRKIRQLADEARDVDEDIRAGMTTLPLLLYLRDHPNTLVRGEIRALWGAAANPVSGRSAEELGEAIRVPIVGTALLDIADSILSGLPPANWLGYRPITPGGPSIALLLQLKMNLLHSTLVNGYGSAVRRCALPAS